MPLKIKRKSIFKTKELSIKSPGKNYKVDDPDTDVVGFRRKGKVKVGVLFTRKGVKLPIKPSKPPKYRGKNTTKAQKIKIKRCEKKLKGKKGINRFAVCRAAVLGKKFPSGKSIPKRLQKKFKKEIKKVRKRRK